MRKTSAAFAITFAYMLHLPLAAWAGDPLPRAKPEEVGMSTERLALIGKAVNAETAKAAGTAAMIGATPMRNNGYKIPIFKAIVARTILGCVGAA